MESVKILFVDDDELFLKLVRYRLKDIKDLEIESISNPLDALEYVKTNKVDIIFVDYFMPKMTGEEFILVLRKFNDSILTILQTGYADKKPPMEMLETLNIQGYFDKTKDPEELEILVRSTIKTHNLMELVKKQKEKIDVLKTKDEFMGSLIVGITDNLKSQTASIAGANHIIKEKLGKKKIGDYGKYIDIIESSINKETNVLCALDFYTNLKQDLKEIFEIISTLLKVKLVINKSNFKVNVEDNTLVNCKSNILILVLIKIIVYLTDNNIELVGIDVKRGDDVEIKILNAYSYDKIFINELITIAGEDKNIKISCFNNLKNININIEKY